VHTVGRAGRSCDSIAWRRAAPGRRTWPRRPGPLPAARGATRAADQLGSGTRLQVTNPIIDSIAAHAALLVAGFEQRTEPFRDVTSVIVHAGTFVTYDTVPGPARGVVSNAPRYLAGQAGHGRGPIVLDWRTAQREIADPEGGTNVIYHEFAHKLDQLDGLFDGMPPLGSNEGRARWAQTMGTNYRRLRRRGRDPLVRAYGATNEAEYFAVVSELFFTVPGLLREHHRRVYDVLADFYKQDPA